MQCPRCGFQQPEDEYCARCGVYVPGARKRRRARTGMGLAFSVLLVAGAVAGVALWFHERGSPQPPSPHAATPARQSIQPVEPPPPPPQRPAPPPKAHKTAKAIPHAPPAPSRPAVDGPTTETGRGEGTEPPAEPGASIPDAEGQIRRWAAQEWVEKGREQAGSPDEEMAAYRRALELDPRFAPAHYYLGMIQWAGEDPDGAMESFRRFLADATPEEKETLLLPEGWAPEEMPPAGQDQPAR